MIKNWKTTLAGISTIIGGIVLIVQGNYAEGVTAIAAGIGLIKAKDNDVK
jgi:hypothetical protein